MNPVGGFLGGQNPFAGGAPGLFNPGGSTIQQLQAQAALMASLASQQQAQSVLVSGEQGASLAGHVPPVGAEMLQQIAAGS